MRGQELVLVEQPGKQCGNRSGPATLSSRWSPGVPRSIPVSASFAGSARPLELSRLANLFPTVSARRSVLSSTTPTARAGIIPTIEWTFTGTAVPLG
jgi:hypothetical protein